VTCEIVAAKVGAGNKKGSRPKFFAKRMTENVLRATQRNVGPIKPLTSPSLHILAKSPSPSSTMTPNGLTSLLFGIAGILICTAGLTAFLLRAWIPKKTEFWAEIAAIVLIELVVGFLLANVARVWGMFVLSLLVVGWFAGIRELQSSWGRFQQALHLALFFGLVWSACLLLRARMELQNGVYDMSDASSSYVTNFQKISDTVSAITVYNEGMDCMTTMVTDCTWFDQGTRYNTGYPAQNGQNYAYFVSNGEMIANFCEQGFQAANSYFSNNQKYSSVKVYARNVLWNSYTCDATWQTYGAATALNRNWNAKIPVYTLLWVGLAAYCGYMLYHNRDIDTINDRKLNIMDDADKVSAEEVMEAKIASSSTEAAAPTTEYKEAP